MIDPEELSEARERNKERQYKTRSRALLKAAERRPILFSAPALDLPVKDDDPLEKHIAARVERYGIEAIDACRDIALMPINIKNPFLVKVKLDACVALMSKIPSNVLPDRLAGSEDSILKALNEAYHKAAPRIASIRERIVTFSDDAKTEMKVVEQSAETLDG